MAITNLLPAGPREAPTAGEKGGASLGLDRVRQYFQTFRLFGTRPRSYNAVWRKDPVTKKGAWTIIPSKPRRGCGAEGQAEGESEEVQSFFSFIQTGVCSTSAARLLLFLRFGLSLAFHIFNITFTVSLKDRFNFTPKLHAAYMGFAGVTCK